MVDDRGAPLAIVVSGAEVHDKRCALEVLDQLVIARPRRQYRVHHLCADKGYDYADIRQGVHDRHYHVHIGRRGVDVTEIPPQKRYPAR